MEKSVYEKIVEFEQWYQTHEKLVEQKLQELKSCDYILTDQNDTDIDNI
jgi:hypothetical protein